MDIDPEDFRIAIANMGDDALALLVKEIQPALLETEDEGFFGSDGINERYRT